MPVRHAQASLRSLIAQDAGVQMMSECSLYVPLGAKGGRTASKLLVI